MHTASSEGEERRPHQMYTHSQYQDEGLLLAQWLASQRHPDGRSFSLAMPELISLDLRNSGLNPQQQRLGRGSAADQGVLRLFVTLQDFVPPRIDGRRLCEDHRGHVQDAKREAFAVTSRLSLMYIAILAGLTGEWNLTMAAPCALPYHGFGWEGGTPRSLATHLQWHQQHLWSNANPEQEFADDEAEVRRSL